MSSRLKSLLEKMERTYKDQLGTRAWVGLATYVVTYDIWAMKRGSETLSGAFWRALDHPHKRWVVGGAWFVVTKHLILPRFLAEKDPLNILGWVVKRLER